MLDVACLSLIQVANRYGHFNLAHFLLFFSFPGDSAFWPGRPGLFMELDIVMAGAVNATLNCVSVL